VARQTFVAQFLTTFMMMKSFIPYRFPVWAILLFVLLAGCQKDRFLPDASRQESHLQTTHYPISLGEA